jgi:hypothetical protein
MDNKNENHQVERDHAATHVSTADKSIDKSVIIKGFNQHFEEFIEDIQSVFPDDDEVKTMKNLLYIIKKTNPRLILETWNSYITIPYRDPIEKSDISFFINKDYTELNIVITDNISKFIERLRGYVRNMTEQNQQKSMQYVKNLCNLTKLYYL